MDLLHFFVFLNIIFLASSSAIPESKDDLIDFIPEIAQRIEFTSIDSRIVGGEEALDEQFPYQAGLLLNRGNSSAWCGGSLIHRRWILTAAHCLRGTQSVKVYLGTHKLFGTNEITKQIIDVDSNDFIIHGLYNPDLTSHDIALIRLSVDARISRDIKIVALPDAADALETFQGVTAVASGWGRFSDALESVSSVLRFANLKVITNNQCTVSFGTLLIQPTNICTDGTTLKSPCNGDSGGPLVYEKNKKKIVIGVVSFGSAQGCEKRYPAVFTRVTSFLAWIKSNTGI